MLFISIVSCLDIYLTIRFNENLEEYERNPIARIMLEADEWEVSRFVAIKCFLTILVLKILIGMFHLTKKHALWVVGGVTICQAMLLAYLLVGWSY